MASFRPLTLNPNGHDALLDAADNLTLENAPQVNTDATNKQYVDIEIDAVESSLTADYDAKIQAEEDARIAADNQLQANIDAEATTRATEDAALQEQINLINGDEPGSDNPYVKRTGDDMSGNLTLGTDKITLDAGAGNADFAGEIIIKPEGETPSVANDVKGVRINASSSAGVLSYGGPFRIYGQVDGTGNYSETKAEMNSDGSANFTGSLEAASIDGGTY